MKKTITAMLEEASASFPNKPYVFDKTDQGYRSVTFGETLEAARFLAAALLSRGLAKEDKAVVLGEGSSRWVISEYAILLAGGISVPLSFREMVEQGKAVDARGGGMAILRNIPVNLKESNPDFFLTVPALTGNFMKKIIEEWKAGERR